MVSSSRWVPVLGSIFLCSLLSLSTGMAAPPPNPPPDPLPNDYDPYPPTDAILYYVRETAYLSGNFVMDVGGAAVSFKITPEDLQDHAVGYYSTFSPSMTISVGDPLWVAMEQKNPRGEHIWPRWFNDASHGYVPGEEANYWPGWRFYFEDRPWEGTPLSDRDLDDLWVDIGWQDLGSGIWILVKVSCNRAGFLNPFDLTFQRVSGDTPIYFSYIISEEASGGAQTTGSFVLDAAPVKIHVFDSGDWWDWASFYGSVPVLPSVAMPLGLLGAALVARKRKRG